MSVCSVWKKTNKQTKTHNVSKNAERSGESSRSPLCVSGCSPDASDYPRPRASSGRSPDSTCGATRRSLAPDLLSFISNRKRKSSHDESIWKEQLKPKHPDTAAADLFWWRRPNVSIMMVPPPFWHHQQPIKTKLTTRNERLSKKNDLEWHLFDASNQLPHRGRGLWAMLQPATRGHVRQCLASERV